MHSAQTPGSRKSVRSDQRTIRAALDAEPAPIISEADTVWCMAELLITPDLQPAVDQLLSRFRARLEEKSIIVADDPAYEQTLGIETVDDGLRLLEDPEDVLADLEELITRDFAERTFPDTVVLATRAFLDEGRQVHLVLNWRQKA